MWSLSDSLLYCLCDQRVAEVSLRVSVPLRGKEYTEPVPGDIRNSPADAALFA